MTRVQELLRDIRLRKPGAPYGECFYCGRDVFERGNITKRMIREGNGHRPDDLTIDHIYPQSGLGREIPTALWWKMLNKVPCCADCNSYKGHLRPLDWLVIMPLQEGAGRLAGRLIELGMPKAEIDDAMRRRA